MYVCFVFVCDFQGTMVGQTGNNAGVIFTLCAAANKPDVYVQTDHNAAVCLSVCLQVGRTHCRVTLRPDSQLPDQSVHPFIDRQKNTQQRLTD